VSKKSKKAKRKGKYDDAPEYVRPAPSGTGFPCTRCGTPLTSVAEQDDHNMQRHLLGAANRE
jgi:hypothetical protein